MTERENMQLVWEHKQPEWVPMITKASQMLISPEINDRPLFQDGKDWFGLQWELDKKHPELMTHVAPGRYVLEDISDWREHIVFPSCREINWDMVAGRTKAMWARSDEMMGYVVCNIGAFERLLSTMGVENALLSFYTDIDALADYANAYADYRIEQMEYFKKYMNADFLMMHDDWGNQTNLFMSPEQWRAVFKEPERRMAQRCHELRQDRGRYRRSRGDRRRQLAQRPADERPGRAQGRLRRPAHFCRRRRSAGDRPPRRDGGGDPRRRAPCDRHAGQGRRSALLVRCHVFHRPGRGRHH